MHVKFTVNTPLMGEFEQLVSFSCLSDQANSPVLSSHVGDIFINSFDGVFHIEVWRSGKWTRQVQDQ